MPYTNGSREFDRDAQAEAQAQAEAAAQAAADVAQAMGVTPEGMGPGGAPAQPAESVYNEGPGQYGTPLGARIAAERATLEPAPLERMDDRGVIERPQLTRRRRVQPGQQQPQPPVWTPPWQPGQPSMWSPWQRNEVVDFMDPRHLWEYDPYLGVSTRRNMPMNFTPPWDVRASDQGMSLQDMYQRYFRG